MDTLDRWIAKADAYTAGYLRTLNIAPSKHNVLTALCVAQFETLCGDAEGGNWGGTTVAQLTSDEHARLNVANLSPSNPDDLASARVLLGPQPNKILGQDSDPQAGWYWIWFYHPNTPADGAAYFVKVLVVQRPACKAILEDDNGTLDALARAMYNTNYFSGHYNPHSAVVTYNNKQMTGIEANIESYRDALLRIQPGIVATLTNWTPGTEVYDLSTVSGLQEALTYLSSKLTQVIFDPGGIDGDLGPKTVAAIKAIQSFASLNVDGVAGDDTKNAILRLITVPVSV
jgi:hypothetical protein